MASSQSPSVSPPPRHSPLSSSPSPPIYPLKSEPRDSTSQSPPMTTLIAHPQASIGSAGVNKRYRPAPAKTFQCRGYGECRMVFSRSEHLARHIRKHTGERPFSCHCGKQFSRLDNLRQHAQTVHADKQDQNERMMRDLTSLHATMAAANKAGNPRGKRTHTLPSAASHPHDHGVNVIKQEELSQSALPMHRPGTTSGYEGDHNGMMFQTTTWHVQTSSIDRPTSRPTNNHSFRDPGQSFLAPHASNASAFIHHPHHHHHHHHQQQQQQQQPSSQSFLSFPSTFQFSVPDRDGRPGSSHSRPLTANGPDSHSRTLPPLASVVSTSIPPPPSQSFPLPPQSTQHVLPLPGGYRRPSTANRPGTAPPTFYPAHPGYIGGPGMVPRSDLPFHAYGRSGGDMVSSFDGDTPTSPTLGEPSPFSWNPPALSDAHPSAGIQGSASATSRKRPFSGTDGPGDSCGPAQDYDYDYGTESRPQSRRLTVMELCNDTDGQFLPVSGSRPTTSSGLTTSTSALALVDRVSHASPPLLARSTPPAAGAAATAAAPPRGGGGDAQDFGGRLSAELRHGIPSPASSAPTPTSTHPHASTGAAASILSNYRGSPYSSPPLSDDSQRASPRGSFPTSARVGGGLQSGGPPYQATLCYPLHTSPYRGPPYYPYQVQQDMTHNMIKFESPSLHTPPLL